MSWIKGTATDYNNLSDKVVAAAVNDSLQTVDSIAAGGSSYVVGDVLTLSGGTSTIAAQVEVTAVSGGAVTAVRRVNDGVYTVAPSDPVATTGGTGTSCTLNCTFANNGWTSLINDTWSGSDKRVMLQGSGGGTDEIYIGWRTLHSTPGNYYNWELRGMTGYSASLPWLEQPGISPGQHDASLNTQRAGAYLLSSNSSQAYWLSVTPYRIIMMVKIGSAYYGAYLGFGNRFATSGEYPYPMLIAGATSWFAATPSTPCSGLSDPWRFNNTDANTRGPSLVYMPDGTWYGVANGSVSASARTALGDRVVLPTGVPTGTGSAGLEDRFMSSTFAWSDLIAQAVLTGNATANLHASPTNVRVLIPCIVVFYDPSPQVPMEIDDVFWVSAFGSVVGEDRIVSGSDVYRVFPNCARSDVYAYLAIREG